MYCSTNIINRYGYVKFFAKVSLVNMKGVELKVKHSVRNVKKFIPPSELKLMDLERTSKFIQCTTFCIKVCNVMLDCGADEAMQCIESESNRKDKKYQPNSNLKEQDTDVVSKFSSAECEGINFN